MKISNSIQICYLLLSILLFVGCNPVQTKSANDCIPSPVTWEFPIAGLGTTRSSVIAFEKKPPNNWQMVANLPESGSIVSIAIRQSDEVWILTDNTLFKYSINTKSWKSYSRISNESVIPAGIFTTQNGEVWGIDVTYNNSSPIEKELPLLSRYDESSDSFIFVDDKEQVFHSGMKISKPPQVLEDKDESFWVILNDDSSPKKVRTGLYNFDPNTKTATRHIAAASNSRFSSLAISPDRIIWVAESENGQLIQFDPATSTAKKYEGLPTIMDDVSNENLRGVANLYFDRVGNLWIEDRGWLDFSINQSPVWHKIIRSPVFISENASMERKFRWGRPVSTYHSSDGMYWFTFSGGLVSLNPITGEWCHFTTGISSIVEDGDGSLWIAVFGSLYKRQRQPLANSSATP